MSAQSEQARRCQANTAMETDGGGPEDPPQQQQLPPAEAMDTHEGESEANTIACIICYVLRFIPYSMQL